MWLDVAVDLAVLQEDSQHQTMFLTKRLSFENIIIEVDGFEEEWLWSASERGNWFHKNPYPVPTMREAQEASVEYVMIRVTGHKAMRMRAWMEEK